MTVEEALEAARLALKVLGPGQFDGPLSKREEKILLAGFAAGVGFTYPTHKRKGRKHA